MRCLHTSPYCLLTPFSACISCEITTCEMSREMTMTTHKTDNCTSFNCEESLDCDTLTQERRLFVCTSMLSWISLILSAGDTKKQLDSFSHFAHSLVNNRMPRRALCKLLSTISQYHLKCQHIITVDDKGSSSRRESSNYSQNVSIMG